MYYLLRSIDSTPVEYAIVDLDSGYFHGISGEWCTDILQLIQVVVQEDCSYYDTSFDDAPHTTIDEYTAFLRADPDCVSCYSIAEFSTIEDILATKQTHPELFI